MISREGGVDMGRRGLEDTEARTFWLVNCIAVVIKEKKTNVGRYSNTEPVTVIVQYGTPPLKY